MLLIFLTIFAPLTIATASGAGRVAKSRLLAAASLGATRFKLLVHVVLPSALPEILTGLRIAIGAEWSTLVAAELIAATRGLGFIVYSASRFLVIDVVIAEILVIGAVALVLDGTAMAATENHAVACGFLTMLCVISHIGLEHL